MYIISIDIQIIHKKGKTNILGIAYLVTNSKEKEKRDMYIEADNIEIQGSNGL